MPSLCSHVTTGVGRLRGEDLAQLLGNAACDVCRLKSTSVNLWLCLFPDCYMMGCAGSRDDHSTSHNKDNIDHCIQLNVNNKRAWCYKCCKEVHLSRNEPKVPGALGVEVVDKSGALGVERKDKPGALGVERENKPGALGVEDKPSNMWPTQGEDTSSLPPGLVGLSNIGNSCYMNSALQCLSNTPALTNFFLNCSSMIPTDEKLGLSRAYLELMEEMWKKNGGHRSLAPAGVIHAVKETWPMFRGFQQHDSQEFLRCFMDKLHRELSEPTDEDNDEDESEEKNATGRDGFIADHVNSFSSGSRSSSEAGEGDIYETADSGMEDQLASTDDIADGRKRKLTDQSEAKDSGLGSVRSFQDGDNKLQDEFPTSLRKKSGSIVNLSDVEYADAMSNTPIKNRQPTNKRPRIRQYHSVISDIFDGKLESSVQCLACGRVSAKTEIFQDLSLPIPSLNALQAVTQGAEDVDSGQSQGGWFSWAWNGLWSWSNGIDVTLLDCLAFFFSADELKGDNMYSCERCNKLRNGLKYSKVVELPDTLSLHLKRFGHDFSQSSKIGTRVTFPLEDLDMSPWLHTDCRSNETRYQLTGIICHHGMAGGGHYTSYVLNCVDNSWYEFDDSFVRPVDAATVAQAEAYVLFYRKNSGVMELLRGKVRELADHGENSLVQFYISKVWLNKFYTMAEPGPIDNSSVICRHGGVHPHRLDTVHDVCTAVLPAVWQFLHGKFGGCVAVNRLKRCDICYAEAEEEERQKKFELDEFKTIHAEETMNKNNGSDTYCVAGGWFRDWERWVLGRARDKPGPVDNQCLVVDRAGSATLRSNDDFLKFSEAIWFLFLALYGGGPQVLLQAGEGGSIRVANPRPDTIRNLTAKLRTKFLSGATAEQKGTWEADKNQNGTMSQQENLDAPMAIRCQLTPMTQMLLGRQQGPLEDEISDVPDGIQV